MMSWVKNMKRGLKKKMSNEVWRQFMRISSDYGQKASQAADNDDQERLQKKADKYSKIAATLKNQTQKNNYLKECSELFYQEKFEDKLDSNCNLIGFENGVFDLETYEFREGHPDDFISFSTNIDYLPYYNFYLLVYSPYVVTRLYLYSFLLLLD